MKYFSYIVLLSKEDKLSGFMVQENIEELLKMDDIQRNQFIEDLNEWNINKYPIWPCKLRDTYIVKGTSRKQVLETMKNLHLEVLPVVSGDLHYEGIIDRETIANQIYDELSELSQYKIKPIA